MTDIFSKTKRSLIMSTIKYKGSEIEKKTANFLKKNGVKYRSHSKSLPGKPDFYFSKIKTVLFVDSCFWHGCKYHGTKPKSNSKFWKRKIARNKQRDKEINRKYKKMGWQIIRIWEHNLDTGMANKKMSDVLKRLRKNDRVIS